MSQTALEKKVDDFKKKVVEDFREREQYVEGGFIINEGLITRLTNCICLYINELVNIEKSWVYYPPGSENGRVDFFKPNFGCNK